MPKLKIDGVEIEIESGTTAAGSLRAGGRRVPRFCFHERCLLPVTAACAFGSEGPEGPGLCVPCGE